MDGRGVLMSPLGMVCGKVVWNITYVHKKSPSINGIDRFLYMFAFYHDYSLEQSLTRTDGLRTPYSGIISMHLWLTCLCQFLGGWQRM